VSRKRATRKPTVAIVGAGRLATFLAVALREAGFTITEIVARDMVRSRRRARALAAKVGAHAVTANSAALNASLLWFAVPDGAIRGAASHIAVKLALLANANNKDGAQNQVRNKVRKKIQNKIQNKVRVAFHSSGALSSRELDPLRKVGVAVASVHPLMTFVAGAHPPLTDVPFAIEGGEEARRMASQIVRELGGESFALPAAYKAAYHAWATLTSPLLLAFLVTLEEAARAAGIIREDARRKSLPIIRQTLANYARLGPARSFSGPLIRGDLETVTKHLAVLRKHPVTRDVYVALARAALRGLPVKNRAGLKRVLRAP
jgi:predicted short-subunit dehydrogenase-like oxidoreductase (DUF2520 family)